MLKSMRTRMTVWFIFLLVPFLLATSYMIVMLTDRATETKLRDSLGRKKDSAVLAMKQPDWRDELEKLAEGASFRQSQTGIIVRDRDDRPVWISGVSTPPKEMPQTDAEKREAREKYRVSVGRSGALWVAVVQPRKPSDSTLPQMLFGLGVVVIAAVGGGAWFMVGRVLSPIRSLAHQTSQASAEHLTVRLESPSQDAEMRDLVDTLNGLLDRVYETAEIKGRFYQAASHELRTPLQALSGHLELATSRKRTAEEYEEVVKESYKQTRRLISLVQGLLFLHQIDSRTSTRPQEPVNLTESCENALEMMYSVALTRHLRLSESFAQNVEIQAIPTHAEVLARNLIENAVKYATEGGEILVTLKVENDHVFLEVENDFPENVKIATENVFEAFYRDDTSRNSKTGGNGLGLAICRAVSSANGWDVKLHQEAGKIRATVNFGALHPSKEQKQKKKASPRMSGVTAFGG